MSTTVNKAQVSQVFEDKKGFNEFLVVKMEYYLPAANFTNFEWLKGIW